MASGGIMLVSSSLSTRLLPHTLPSLTAGVWVGFPWNTVEKVMLKWWLGCHYQEKGGLNARQSKTVNCALQGFILKIFCSLHIILRNWDFWGSYRAHSFVLYSECHRASKRFSRQMCNNFKVSEKWLTYHCHSHNVWNLACQWKGTSGTSDKVNFGHPLSVERTSSSEIDVSSLESFPGGKEDSRIVARIISPLIRRLQLYHSSPWQGHFEICMQTLCFSNGSTQRPCVHWPVSHRRWLWPEYSLLIQLTKGDSDDRVFNLLLLSCKAPLLLLLPLLPNTALLTCLC